MSQTQPHEKETFIQQMMRTMKNSCTYCFGCVQQLDEKAKISYKESQIAGRKKKFGVDYIDLVKKEASQEELKKCVDDCLADIKKMDEEIDELKKEIERVEQETKGKIVQKPQTAAATAAPQPASATTQQDQTTTPTPVTPVATKEAEK